MLRLKWPELELDSVIPTFPSDASLPLEVLYCTAGKQWHFVTSSLASGWHLALRAVTGPPSGLSGSCECAVCGARTGRMEVEASPGTRPWKVEGTGRLLVSVFCLVVRRGRTPKFFHRRSSKNTQPTLPTPSPKPILFLTFSVSPTTHPSSPCPPSRIALAGPHQLELIRLFDSFDRLYLPLNGS